MSLIYDVKRAILAQNSLIVIDKDKEYENLCRQLGGTVIKLNPGTASSINILEIGAAQSATTVQTEKNIHSKV